MAGPLKSLARLAARLGRDRRGGVMVLVGLAFFMLFGIAGVAVDSSYLYVLKTELQGAADSAALAGSRQLPDETAARVIAQEYAGKNLLHAVHGNTLADNDVVAGQWDSETRSFTAGATPPNAIEVTLRRSGANGNAARTFFMRMFGFDSVDVTAVSLATATAAGQPGCIIALDGGSTSESLRFNSMDSAELNECVPVANSTHPDAITINSLDSFHAGSLYSAGGYDANSIGSFNLDEPAQTEQPPIGDPYGHLSNPSFGTCDYVNYNAGSSISPGVYCGGLDVSGKGSLTIQPGTYYIVDGDLDFSSIGNISCNCSAAGSGVTFVITGTTPGQIGKYSISSIDSVSLQAPADGSYDYPGMLIYVDRRASYETSIFNSIDSLTLNGALYAASQELSFNSIDYTAQTDCAQTVGLHVSFNSIDSFGRADNCPAYGTQAISIGGTAGSLVR